MIIPRHLVNHLQELGSHFPVLSVTGPRQAGKTTLLRELFKEYRYVTFEAPDVKLYFQSDPRGFLREYSDNVIFDEAQHVPELFSYLQGIVDEDRRPGRFILSGSQNFLMRKSITQSLAGRIGIAKLFPLDFQELKHAGHLPEDYLDAIFKGGYPAQFANPMRDKIFYSNYIDSYVQRDVQELIDPGNLSTFQRFLVMAAGSAGQMLNYSNIATVVGVSVPTIKSWFSILEQSYIVFRLDPFFRQINRRLVKSPKLYFYDTGLLCYLLGIQDASFLRKYHNFGSLFENLIIADAVKRTYHDGSRPRFHYYRDSNGVEVDLVYDTPAKAILWEIKATETYHPRLNRTLNTVAGRWDIPPEKRLIYGGAEEMTTNGINVKKWFSENWQT
jgi:predicted AAA+ superfamily ATPase